MCKQIDKRANSEDPIMAKIYEHRNPYECAKCHHIDIVYSPKIETGDGYMRLFYTCPDCGATGTETWATEFFENTAEDIENNA